MATSSPKTHIMLVFPKYFTIPKIMYRGRGLKTWSKNFPCETSNQKTHKLKMLKKIFYVAQMVIGTN